MTRLDFLPKNGLPNVGPVSKAFLEHGIESFFEAARTLHAIPYGRNSDRGDYSLVLPENRGTCSTKHGLLVSLAQ